MAKPTLRTIFDLIGGIEKHHGSPPRKTEYRYWFHGGQFSAALKHLGKLRPETSIHRRVVHYWADSTGNEYIAVVEHKKEKQND